MGAKKGNNYAKGNKGGPGREPLYKTPEEMHLKINAYFKKERVPTIPGLAYNLGFASRQSLLEYEAKEEFSFPIKRAKLFIESFNAKELHRKEGGVTGIIFTLKNLGWSDNQAVDLNIDLQKLSDEALAVITNNLINYEKGKN